MLISIDNMPSTSLIELKVQHADARANYFAHTDLGGLTPAQQKAWNFEHFALQLLLQSAHVRLAAEEEMQALMQAEAAA